MASDVDYAALFAATASPYLVLDPDLIIVDVNQAYLALTGRTRQDLVGTHIFEVPDNPDDPDADGVRKLTASLRWVLDSGRRDTMPLLKYDIPDLGHPGVFEERWWAPVNTPVPAPDGSVRWIIHRAEDVTAFVEAYRAQRRTSDQDELDQIPAFQAELYARAMESQRRSEELREAHAHAREVAITLQEVMLRTPDLPAHRDIAVRYLPASTSLNVCGDWYEIVDLPHDNTALAVGDVVGHGLGAAAVMGMLRSALSTALRAVPSPAPALEILGLYARSIEDALGTTVVTVLIDRRSRLIIYSNAGHPPPVLAHTGRGSYELLDQATDPPLCVRPLPVPQPQASVAYAPGDVLVLYTDGLIERRGEDIDVGLRRLADAVTEYRELDVEVLADMLINRLDVTSGSDDDIALVVVRL